MTKQVRMALRPEVLSGSATGPPEPKSRIVLFQRRRVVRREEVDRLQGTVGLYGDAHD